MKILQIVSAFEPCRAYGGPVPVVLELSKELVKRGHEVTVYTSDLLDEKTVINKKKDSIGGIDVLYFSNLSTGLAWRRHVYISVSGWLWLIRNVHRFDVIHLHEYRTYNNILVHYLARFSKVPYVITTHGFIKIAMKSFRKKKWYDILFGSVLTKAKYVHVLTEDEKQDAINFGIIRQQIALIANGVVIHDTAIRPNTLGKRLASIKNGYIFFLGRINRVKGLDILLKGLSTARTSLDLAIAGPDEGYEQELKTMAKSLGLEKRTHFLGPLYGDDKANAFMNCRFFALTSRHEGMPISVLEACSFSKPVLITKQCNLPDVKVADAGVVVDFSSSAVAKAIEDLERRDLGKLGRNALKLVKDNYTWARIAGQVEGLYEN